MIAYLALWLLTAHIIRLCVPQYLQAEYEQLGDAYLRGRRQ